ncbi:family 43 glycosylhydrolase [Microbacterium sp. 22303]|uniref:family 43 glycosylhydrolase n=1 Tax=Microbacterium sp. 22303 TaxID=3453905 RepID=UPI003F85AEDB
MPAVNPVIRGFAPDPSMLRVDEWFYVATSSFEWYPTIPIRRSRDLVEWEYVGSVEGAVPEGHLHGVPDSAGIWAPSMSHDGERFWMAYAIVRTFLGRQLDVETYVTTAPAAQGPWSTPARVSGHGFDPSIFHHEGAHYLLNLQCDSRSGGSRFSGILIARLNDEGTRIAQPPVLLLQHATLIEGPKLLHRDGWFHLMLAQGGTGVEHGVLMARSRELFGPYELDEQPLLTSRDDSGLRLQKAGHGELLQDEQGRWFLGHLASRWLDTAQGRQFPWGRETCVQEIEWRDGWPRLASGGWHPADTFTPPVVVGDAAPKPVPPLGAPGWPWRTSRSDGTSWAVTAPDGLRIRGRHGLESLFGASLVAQPLRERSVQLGAIVDADPRSYTEGAGIVLWYDSTSYYSLAITWVEPDGQQQRGQQWRGEGSRAVVLTARDAIGARVLATRRLSDRKPVELVAVIDGAWAHFSVDGEPIGPSLDVGILSDDYAGGLRFTGAMVGVFAFDVVSAEFSATFRNLNAVQYSQEP